MKRNLIILGILYSLGVSGIIAQTPLADKGSVGFADISLNKSDPGMNWMISEWMKVPRSNSIKALMQKFTINHAQSVIATSPKTGELVFVVILETKENLETASAQKTIADIVKGEITAPSYLKATYNGVTLYHGPRGKTGLETAYLVNGNKFVMGTDLSAVKKIADVITQGKDSISSLPDYQDLKSKTLAGSNVILYMNNSDSIFSNTLKKQERKWKMSLLLSAKDISGIVTGLNFVNGDKLTGSAIFKANSATAIPDIKDDANFLGEAIRRKFSHSKITYTKQVTVNGNYVTLTFEMNGLKPLFTQLFQEGISSLLE